MLENNYRLDDQVGFLLRRAHQRHRSIFANTVGNGIVPTQFAALVKLREQGPVSQNVLGRMTAMDSATIAGVVERLVKRGLVTTATSPDDSRMRIVELTDEGRNKIDGLVPSAVDATKLTLRPLTPRERDSLLRLLVKIC